MLLDKDAGMQFSHTLGEQIGGQLEADSRCARCMRTRMARGICANTMCRRSSRREV
ncbi:hypothetical protein BAAM1489_05765 [Bifidobacterium animalis subsp. animalis MCC 1489]|nr:hypothetical protein [Bifidobacterium animalis]AFI62256.1 hypothetical protein BANAN_00145 [Bifidobacterium animalis subsp. animalis ATCC 25527]KOA63449.1 hypothetical protein BAAM1489_05765 [Bifidobacterium animalis subsp. animalis MCC 1489]